MIDLSSQIENMKRHIAADELVRGVGFEHGKGCFVGCTFDRYDHEYAEKVTGVPEWLWHLCDTLHECMSDDVDRGRMALSLLNGFQRCENFEHLRHDICAFIQRRNIPLVEGLNIDAGLKAQVLAAIKDVLHGHEQRLPKDHEHWSAARSAAWSTARSAESAAWSTVARSAAEAARSAAWSTARSAESAAWSTAARSAEYDAIGQELMRLLGVPVPEVG